MAEKKFSFLNNITDEDRILLSHVLDMANAAKEKYVTKFTFFLDDRQQELCRQVLMSEKLDNYLFWGGFDQAERKMLGLFHSSDESNTEDFPVKSICFTYRKADKLTHRDFLGVLMSLQIERRCVGDIIVGEGCTNVMVADQVAERVLCEISKIGRVGVKASEGFDESVKPKIEMSEITGTVSSLRADCLLSFSLHISREKAAALIRQHGISINHMMCYKADSVLKESDVFSVKGHGKYVLKSINGVSKKEKIRITLCKFI